MKLYAIKLYGLVHGVATTEHSADVLKDEVNKGEEVWRRCSEELALEGEDVMVTDAEIAALVNDEGAQVVAFESDKIDDGGLL